MLNDQGWLDMEDPASDLRGMRGLCLTGCIFAMMGAPPTRLPASPP
jgi:hypothetical protein